MSASFPVGWSTVPRRFHDAVLVPQLERWPAPRDFVRVVLVSTMARPICFTLLMHLISTALDFALASTGSEVTDVMIAMTY